jgi:hypothetical protein
MKSDEGRYMQGCIPKFTILEIILISILNRPIRLAYYAHSPATLVYLWVIVLVWLWRSNLVFLHSRQIGSGNV